MNAVSEEVSYIPSWYDAYHSHLSRLAVLLGHRQEDAEDLVSQFFVGLMEKRIDEELILNPQAFLTTAFKRKLIDIHRQAKSKLFIVTDDIPRQARCSQPTVLEAMEQKQVQEDLVKKMQAAYKTLPERCKKVIYMKYYEGLSHDEIAAQTGLSKRSVYNNIFEGIKHLRCQLNNTSQAVNPMAFIPFLSVVAALN